VDPHGGVGGHVEQRLDVEHEDALPETNRDAGPIAEPLGAREAGHVGLTSPGGLAGALRLPEAQPRCLQGIADEGHAVGKPVLVARRIAEGREGPVPALPQGEELPQVGVANRHRALRIRALVLWGGGVRRRRVLGLGAPPALGLPAPVRRW